MNEVVDQQDPHRPDHLAGEHAGPTKQFVFGNTDRYYSDITWVHGTPEERCGVRN